MIYNFKRALGFGFLLYLSTFVVGILCGIVSGQDQSSMKNIPDSFWYIGMAAGVLLTAVFTHLYFRNKSLIPTPTSGFYFGATTVVISFVLDYALFSLGNTQGAEVDMWDYYGDYRFWIIIILVIATAKIVGYLKNKRLR